VIDPHDRPLRGPPQEPRIDERIQHVATVIGADVPEANGLAQRQFKARHLVEIAPNAIGDGRKIHRRSSDTALVQRASHATHPRLPLDFRRNSAGPASIARWRHAESSMFVGSARRLDESVHRVPH
jgi:hypothetical protein